MDFAAGHRETITEVCSGDLVIVRLEVRDGKLLPDAKGRLPYLVYKPTFAGLDITAARRNYVHGEDASPEWEIDIGPIWTPAPGLLAIAGGAGDARFRVFHTVHRCRPDPSIEHTLSFYRAIASVPRPRGAQWVRVGSPANVRLSSASYNANVSMQPAGQRYPLGFATTIQPLSLTSLFFGIVL